MAIGVLSPQFVPRQSSVLEDIERPSALGKVQTGVARPEGFAGWTGGLSLAPHAAGANTTYDKATAFRQQEDLGRPLSWNEKTGNSWLFKNS